MADGSVMSIAGERDISINSTLILKNVLHVPKLCTSLIYVQKLAADSNLFVIFSSNSCILREQKTKQMIGLAKEKDGLYFFKNSGEYSRVNTPSSSSFQSKSVMSNEEQIWLQHRILGHPSFNVLKIIFPSLFKNISIESLHCDICEFAKHKRASYPISNTRSLFLLN